jgi:TRAP-type C4-dicarboxylate transport system permease small subunit
LGGFLLRTAVDLTLGCLRLLLGFMLLASVVLICANAFGRYVLLSPIIWAEEILGYGLVWMIYLGAVLVTASDEHLRMDLVIQLLGEKSRAFFHLLGNVVFIAVALLIIYQAPATISEFTHHSQVANLPMDVVHVVIPVSFVAIVLLLVGKSVQNIQTLMRGGGTAITDNPA